MELLGHPAGAKIVLRDRFGRLGNPHDHILAPSEVSESLVLASGVNFADFRVLAFAILGSVLVPFE